MMRKRANYFRAIGERLYTHSNFCAFLPEDPGQKALQAMNGFTLFVDFCLIPLSKTCKEFVKTDLYPLSRGLRPSAGR